MSRALLYSKALCVCLLAAFSFSACRSVTPDVSGSPPAPTPTDVKPVSIDMPSPTPLTPTATPQPLAAQVNGQPITLAEYEAELALYRAAVDADLTAEDEQRVLDDLIGQELLAQGAIQDGFEVTDVLLDERIQSLAAQRGGQAALDDWMNTYGYRADSFRSALTRSIAAAWMRDQIIAAVPLTAEQVHVVQILLYDPDEADQIYAQLQAGNDFYNLAVAYDSITGGDLGWFPRGYLPHPNLEEAAFSLQPDTFSPVVETSAGYHILYLVERDPQRALSLQALLVLQTQALEEWLAAQRSSAQIEVLAR